MARQTSQIVCQWLPESITRLDKQIKAELSCLLSRKAIQNCMKRSALFMLAGGLLAAVAFFLPFFVFRPEAGVFSSGNSLLYGIQHYFEGLGSIKASPFQIIIGIVTNVLEPAAAILLIVGGLLASQRGRAAYVLGIIGAVFSLTLLVWYFTFFYALFIGFQPGISVGEFVRVFGSGYWLAGVGCLLGLVGAMAGWLQQSTQGMFSGERTRGVRPGALLALGGGLALTVSFFIPSVLPIPPEQSLFEYMTTQPILSLEFWPEPLAILLLLAGGLFAFSGRAGAYLGSLVGALVGLTFLLLFRSPVLPGLGNILMAIPLGMTYWLALGGSALGLLGALLGLREQEARPVPAEPPTPVPS